jgi:hypothetical protein
MFSQGEKQLAQGEKQLETREIIKILSHPCYPRNFD